MATITATYLDDLGRIRITLVDAVPGVRYRVQRSTADDPTWVDVRGGGFLSTTQTTILDDYEYTPNIVNFYRLIEPAFYDAFDRAYPSGGALSLSGAIDSYAWTADHASLDDTTDIDLRVEATTTWGGTQQGLLSKYNINGNQRSYRLTIESTGRLRLTRSPDGTATTTLTSTVAVPISTGRLSVRMTLDVDNGAGGHTATFYTGISGVDGPWVQLGTPVTVAGTIANFASTSPLEVGSWNDGNAGQLVGQIHAAQMRSSIAGSNVANPDFEAQPAGTTSFVDSTGKTWNVGVAAEIIEISPVPGFDWGTANTGQTWSLGGSGSAFSVYVDNGVGVIGSATPSGLVAEMQTSAIPGLEDGEITWSAIYPSPANLLDADVEWGVGLRSTGWSDLYESNLRFRTETDDYAVELRLGKHVANVYTQLGDTGPIGTWVPGIPWHVRFRVQGSTLSARAWQEGSPEPQSWNIVVIDMDIVAGNSVYVRAVKSSGTAYEQWFGPMEAHTIPATIADTISLTPLQDEVWLKSIAFPMFNRQLECVDWEELERSSRTAFFDVKGRHQILGVADVGSTATFTLTFISYSRAENQAIVALLTYGGLMLLQPPGDDESEDCPVAYSGIPEGYVMSGDYVQSRTVYGKPQWLWTVTFTQVAPSDGDAIVPVTITWTQLWEIIGPDGTWEDVWALWSSWQEIWLTAGNPLTFGELV